MHCNSKQHNNGDIVHEKEGVSQPRYVIPAKAGISYRLLQGAGLGYILTHFGRPYRTARSAVKTKPRYAGLVPKGSLSLTQNDGTVKQTLKYIEINELVKAGAFRRFKFTFVKGLVY